MLVDVGFTLQSVVSKYVLSLIDSYISSLYPDETPFYTVLIQCAEFDAFKSLRLRHDLKFKTVPELLLVRPMADCT